jgi:hypothetical protein
MWTLLGLVHGLAPAQLSQNGGVAQGIAEERVLEVICYTCLSLPEYLAVGFANE